ncbi:MAG TPA: RHS repeat-associated core domain-containing protein [Bacteroidales bacterium]|nr:RHS repeat-associated core domain-containing protein [Bacteroidales bacterium]HRC79340.1 RHS repeat-associated core domain-containing protein [Bacteroidales bacterium]
MKPIIQYLPFGELFVSQRNSEFDTRYKFTAKELDNETSYTYFGARYYDSELSGWLSVDPMSDKYPSLSPYCYTANNPVVLVDPNGMDTIDIVKNDDGKWSISNTQIVKGDDVFRVKTGDKTQTYTFSEGEYGKRVNVLNLENNEDYTLGIYHVSGQEGEGATGYAVTPGGEPSTTKGSHKRLPDDVYTITPTNSHDHKWVQPLISIGEKSGNVSGRGVKIHPAPSKLPFTEVTQWTDGCFVISTDYFIKNGLLYYNSNTSINTSTQINTLLGATKHYNAVGTKNRPGSDFNNGINFKLIQKSGF